MPFVVLGLVVAGAVWMHGMRYGQHHARALRSWRDLVMTKNSIAGLTKNVIAQWRKVLRRSVEVAAFVVAVLFIGWSMTKGR